MTICFEGPSAIGKTKMSESFSEEYHIVPEVNQLFKRTKLDSKYWYYEKQVERYESCKDSELDSILDGDNFQPIWYNWIYQYPSEFLSKEETQKFYLEKLIEKKIDFPDLYIIFYAELEELIRRKELDQSRTRRNFEKHLQYINPQRAYFEFLKEHTEIKVEFVMYDNFEETRERVLSLMQSTSIQPRNSQMIFEKLIKWLENYQTLKTYI